MKYYTFTVHGMDEDILWNFAHSNLVDFSYICENFKYNEVTGLSIDFRNYVYAGYMSEETYVLFRLIVPAVIKYDTYPYLT
jgi:hypothetical protein